MASLARTGDLSANAKEAADLSAGERGGNLSIFGPMSARTCGLLLENTG